MPLENVFLGITTKAILNRKLNEGDITQKQFKTCLHSNLAFYRMSLEYLLQKMDTSKTLWVHAMVIIFFKRKDAVLEDIEYFATQFKSLLQFDNHEVNILYEQFIDRKILEEEELPSDALKDEVLQENKDSTSEYGIDVI